MRPITKAGRRIVANDDIHFDDVLATEREAVAAFLASAEGRAHDNQIRMIALNDAIAAVNAANTAGGSCKSNATGAIRTLFRATEHNKGTE